MTPDEAMIHLFGESLIDDDGEWTEPEIDPVQEELQRRNDELSDALAGIGSGLDTTPWLPALARKQCG